MLPLSSVRPAMTARVMSARTTPYSAMVWPDSSVTRVRSVMRGIETPSWASRSQRYRQRPIETQSPVSDDLVVGLFVVGDHPLGGEALLHVAPAVERVDVVYPLDCLGDLAPVVDHDPALAVAHHLGNGAVPRGDHRGPARHRLDHDEAERLLPLDRKERRARVLKQLDLRPVIDLAEVLDPVAQVRLDELGEVLALLRLARLPCELERQAKFHRDGHGSVRALLVVHPAEEEQVVAAVRLARVVLEVERIRDVRDPVERRLRPPLVHRKRDQADL